jgi:hypothetical protein
MKTHSKTRSFVKTFTKVYPLYTGRIPAHIRAKQPQCIHLNGGEKRKNRVDNTQMRDNLLGWIQQNSFDMRFKRSDMRGAQDVL